MSSIPRPGTEVVPKPWQTGLAPVYIGMFLWVAFFDQVGRRSLPVGGLWMSILGAAAAGPVAYLLLFRPSANWGHRASKPLKVIASGTFGVRGAAIVPGLLLALAQIALFAMAVGYAIELTFQALVITGFAPAQSVRPGQLGGATLKSPLYLITALIWAVATALVSMRFVRWIAYLMHFFPIFPAVMLGGAMLATLGGLRSFQETGVDPFGPNTAYQAREGALHAFLFTFQWVFAFASLAGVMGADWGAGSVGPDDVRKGGWVGLGLAPGIVAALALIAIAGYQGSVEGSRVPERPRTPGRTTTTITDLADQGPGRSPAPAPGLDAPPYTFRAALNGGFGPRIGGLMLATFGLASLAPAVYSSFMFGEQLKELGPGISRLSWTMMGTFTAWLLVVGGWFDRADAAFDLLGATFAPVAGAMAADYRRHRGAWPGPRRGFNPAGMAAWLAGLAVGLAPSIGRVVRSDSLAGVQPASLLAFVAAYLVYELLAATRAESTVNPSEAG